MKTKTKVHITSAIFAVTGAILAFGATIKDVPGLPGWMTGAWPFVFFLATIIDRAGTIYVDQQKK